MAHRFHILGFHPGQTLSQVIPWPAAANIYWITTSCPCKEEQPCPEENYEAKKVINSETDYKTIR